MKGPWKILEGLEEKSPQRKDTGGQSADKYPMFSHTWKTPAPLQVFSHGQCPHGDRRTQQDLKGGGATRCSLLPCARSRSLLAQLQLEPSHVVLLSRLRCWTSSQKNGGMMGSGSEGCLQNDGDPNLPISKGQDSTSITDVYGFASLVMFFQGKRRKNTLSLRKALRIWF